MESFYGNLSSLANGSSMFDGCTKLSSFGTDTLDKLTNGNAMFRDCFLIKTFDKPLGSLTDNYRMFYNCTSMAIIDSDLPMIESPNEMFIYCSKLESYYCVNTGIASHASELLPDSKNSLKNFSSIFPNLTDANGMFMDFGKLERFVGDLNVATSATQMFRNCTSLNYVDMHCPLLTNGNHMFRNCSSLTFDSFSGNECFSNVTSALAMF